MGSGRGVIVLQHDQEVGRNNAIVLVLHCNLSVGPRELCCGPGKEEAKQASCKGSRLELTRG